MKRTTDNLCEKRTNETVCVKRKTKTVCVKRTTDNLCVKRTTDDVSETNERSYLFEANEQVGLLTVTVSKLVGQFRGRVAISFRLSESERRKKDGRDCVKIV